MIKLVAHFKAPLVLWLHHYNMSPGYAEPGRNNNENSDRDTGVSERERERDRGRKKEEPVSVCFYGEKWQDTETERRQTPHQCSFV